MKAFGIRLPRRLPERLLMDTVRGNPTLFMRHDEVEAAWEFGEPTGRLGIPAGTTTPLSRRQLGPDRGDCADRT